MGNEIINEYFEWLYEYVESGGVSFRKLLMFLHNTEFTWTIFKDKNRASDGLKMRHRFAVAKHYNEALVNKYIDGPCSVLEMMIALAIRCEENIMDDTRYGNRTKQWFWGMISSLGLNGMYDDRFDKKLATVIVNKFLNREYKSNGKGGLFTIKNCDRDVREMEIWYQLNWYLDN